MDNSTKIIIGAATALLLGTIMHFLGTGERFVGRLEQDIATAFVTAEIKDIKIKGERHPSLKRSVTLLGAQDNPQRADAIKIAESIEGIGQVNWQNMPVKTTSDEEDVASSKREDNLSEQGK
ncbi:hypothetical protein [Sphingorhabdus lutea]|nr:hypothetical protein [Sphingorhabdus lutea]